MNSAVRPIFNKSFVEKRDLWICEQCMRPIGKAEKLKPLLKKKKKKGETLDVDAIQTLT